MRRTLTLILLPSALLAAAACARAGADAAPPAPAPQTTPAPAATPDLAAYFKDRAGTFVLFDSKAGRYLRHNPSRAAERFPPFSTFKIPNSLIGLETGVIRDADFEIKWDAKKYPSDDRDIPPFNMWWRDHTLRTAFKNSVLWYYRELATRVGERRMKEMVDKLDYGNEDTSGGLTNFWLNRGLKISADEQVEFLKRLHAGRLPFDARNVALVKEIMTVEETPAYKLSGKTGGGAIGEERYLGWFVGYLEAQGNTYFFATQIEGPTYLSIRDERIRLTRAVLADLGLIPQSKQ